MPYAGDSRPTQHTGGCERDVVLDQQQGGGVADEGRRGARADGVRLGGTGAATRRACLKWSRRIRPMEGVGSRWARGRTSAQCEATRFR